VSELLREILFSTPMKKEAFIAPIGSAAMKIGKGLWGATKKIAKNPMKTMGATFTGAEIIGAASHAGDKVLRAKNLARAKVPRVVKQNVTM